MKYLKIVYSNTEKYFHERHYALYKRSETSGKRSIFNALDWITFCLQIPNAENSTLIKRTI